MAPLLNDAENPPIRIFIFDSTRLRSHLIFRYLSTNPQLEPIYHPFLMARMFGRDRISQHLRHSEMRRKEAEEDMKPFYGDDTIEGSRGNLLSAVHEAEKNGRIPMANEHWFNVLKIDSVLDSVREDNVKLSQNPTNIPDELFDSLTPVLLIRDPALSINSLYRDALVFTKERPGDEDFELLTMNRPIRLLFDHFTSLGRQPIVVDAEDILWRTEEMIQGLCRRLQGVNPAEFCDVWEATPQHEIEKMNPMLYMLTKNIQHSTGIQRPKQEPADPTIDEAFQTWTSMYGETVAGQLKALADDNMPHYEYLRSFAV